MSSSNLVRIAAISETTYGVTPGSGNFKTVRFTSEKLSGTPNTTQSAQIRTDRMASGQIVTGLQVGGEISFELAREATLDLFLASGMFNNWETFTLQTVDLVIDASDPDDITLTRATGSWVSDGYKVGQFATLAAFTAAANNTQIMFADIVSATVARIVGPADLASGAGTTTTIKRSDRLSIGTTKKSFSIEKTFLDLATKAILYRGMLVGNMSINASYGDLMKGSFSLAGNGYETVDASADFITNGRTIDAPATSDTLNGSIDMPFLANSAIGELSSAGLALQSIGISINNNLTAQNVIGRIAPRDQNPGTAQIEVSLSAYLSDEAWPLVDKKLTQEAFAVGFIVRNGDGWYAFFMPAVQASFDDPASGGQNQDINLEMKGTAKVGDDGSSALYIYRS